MEYRVFVRASEKGFDAWTPDRPNWAARGHTEADALRNLQHAIEGSLDLAESLEKTELPATEYTLRVESPGERHQRLEAEQAIPPEPLVPIGGWTLAVVGGTVAVLGLIGIGFFFSIGAAASPFFLFAPFIVLALGIGGLVFGIINLQSQKAA